MDILPAVAQQLLRYITKDKDTLYVFCPCSIGDFLIAGGLVHALLKKKRKKACVMILNERFENSGSINFVGVQEIRYMPSLLIDFIRQYIYATRDYETDNFVYGHFKMGQNGYIMNSNLSFVDRYKENVFGLPLDTELLPPLVNPPTDYERQILHKNYILDKERTIILTPYANSIVNLEESFWIKLVSGLKQKNNASVIYTNVAAPHEKVISETSPMVTTFPELFYLAEKVNCFIGLRSGIFDFLAFTNARLLYINRGIGFLDNLYVNFNHINGRAFCLAKDEEQAHLQTVIQQNNIPSIDNVNFYGHVWGRDVALDTDSLLKKIISAVD